MRRVRSTSPARRPFPRSGGARRAVALASDEERLASKRFDELDAGELVQLYRLMARLEAATRPAPHAPPRARAPRAATSTCAAACARACAPAASRSHWPAAGAATCRAGSSSCVTISGSMEPYARAYLQFLVSAAGSGPRAEAFVFATRLTRLTRALRGPPPGACDPARRRGSAGLVERHADRRRVEGVQRPPRPARDGARRDRGDPLRRLGARRPGAGGTRDAATPRGSRTGSCGSTRA